MEAGGVGHPAQRLSLFDLDNTLIAGDSDYGWAQFLIEAGVVDADLYERRNAGFFADYKAGTLDIRAFLDFQLRPLAEHEPSELLAWRERFMAEKIEPMFLAEAKALVDARRDAGDLVAVVTATNSFVTRPIAQRYGIAHLVATEPETVNGRFTGRTVGEPCFREGKLVRVKQWLETMDLSLRDFADTWFYSDSHNDLPLLSAVSRPVAVDPDPVLRQHAVARGWPVVTWRGNRG
jgi:HAD superfamily hydrolase (TIGR01490 family)